MKSTQLQSPNCDEREAGTAVVLIVIHAISLPPERFGGDGVERLFTNRLDASAHPSFEPLRGLTVSAHFFVRRDGALIQFVSCDDRAWHAGQSRWEGRANCNDFSIGIELEGLEGETFEPAQYDALGSLLQDLAQAYPVRAIVGHEHVAPGRKFDPGAGFDWDRLHTRLLFVHHVDDACMATPYAMARRIADRRPLVSVHGGDLPRSDPCEAFSAHGFPPLFMPGSSGIMMLSKIEAIWSNNFTVHALSEILPACSICQVCLPSHISLSFVNSLQML